MTDDRRSGSRGGVRAHATGDLLQTPDSDELVGVHISGVRRDASGAERGQPRVPVCAVQLVLPSA